MTKEQYEVMNHTSSTGRYLTGDGSRDYAVCIELAALGWLRDHGPQTLTNGDHYYTTTPSGRQALNEHRAALPQPKPLTKSQRRYRRYLSVGDCFRSFRHFLEYDRTNPTP